jgi:hypothetical protein
MSASCETEPEIYARGLPVTPADDRAAVGRATDALGRAFAMNAAKVVRDLPGDFEGTLEVYLYVRPKGAGPLGVVVPHPHGADGTDRGGEDRG